MKFEITDVATYRTVFFTIEDDNGKVYNVSVRENDFDDEWSIMDEDGNDIDDKLICTELIIICEAELNK